MYVMAAVLNSTFAHFSPFPPLSCPLPSRLSPRPPKGIEDALGNMDFKVAGTRNGITFMQVCQSLVTAARHILTKTPAVQSLLGSKVM